MEYKILGVNLIKQSIIGLKLSSDKSVIDTEK